MTSAPSKLAVPFCGFDAKLKVRVNPSDSVPVSVNVNDSSSFVVNDTLVTIGGEGSGSVGLLPPPPPPQLTSSKIKKITIF